MNIKSIPESLTAQKRWVCAGTPSHNNPKGKAPKMPSGLPAEVDNPETWSSFEDCVSALEKKPLQFMGVGFGLRLRTYKFFSYNQYINKNIKCQEKTESETKCFTKC
jgi:primase-polymerase (primpol)-like protein